MSLGTKLKELRLAKGWTQTQLATHVSGTMNAGYVSDLEHDRAQPSHATFVKLAQVLCVDLNTLADVDTTTPPAPPEAKHYAFDLTFPGIDENHGASAFIYFQDETPWSEIEHDIRELILADDPDNWHEYFADGEQIILTFKVYTTAQRAAIEPVEI